MVTYVDAVVDVTMIRALLLLDWTRVLMSGWCYIYVMHESGFSV